MKKLLCEICDEVNKSETKVLSEAECRRYLKRYRTILTQGGKEMPKILQRRDGKRGRIAQTDAHNLHKAMLILEPKFSSWGKTVLWQVIDVEPITVFGMFENG